MNWLCIGIGLSTWDGHAITVRVQTMLIFWRYVTAVTTPSTARIFSSSLQEVFACALRCAFLSKYAPSPPKKRNRFVGDYLKWWRTDADEGGDKDSLKGWTGAWTNFPINASKNNAFTYEWWLCKNLRRTRFIEHVLSNTFYAGKNYVRHDLSSFITFYRNGNDAAFQIPSLTRREESRRLSWPWKGWLSWIERLLMRG